MLRGTKKNMIVVRTRESRFFEEAYFVMRRDNGIAAMDEADMLWEANRILESALPTGGKPPFSVLREEGRRWPRRFFWFAMGFFCGGGLTGLLWFLL